MEKFVHLHVHSDYSLLDGLAKIDKLVERVLYYKMPALAITDHGNMFGAVKFYKKVSEKGIRPIIGMEAYIAPGDMTEKRVYPQIPESNFHLTLLASTTHGYKNLIKLSSQAWLKGFYYKPRIDKSLLAELSSGIIALSGCLKGEIPFYLRTGNKEKAKEALYSYLDIFGRENFYLELLNLNTPETNEVTKKLLEISRKEKVDVVATNDVHYISKDDYEAHDVLLAIQTGKKVADKERLRFGTKEVYFKSPEEMMQQFREVPEAIKNTLRIAERCNIFLNLNKDFYLPRCPIPENYLDDFYYLEHIAKEGFKKKFPSYPKVYAERLERELKIIKKMGFSGYFIIAKDIVDYARENSIPVGPGRGSAVGSLILYCLGITEIDPLKYNLIFERFLNPERVTLPDIDIDFGDEERDKVIEYIQRKYGKENVAKIITFDTMKARAAIRDVSRAMGLPYGEADRIAKLIPSGLNLKTALETNAELKEIVERNEIYRKLFEIAMKLEGISRHASIHASGVVISPKPLTEFLPLYHSDNEISTQYDMKAIEDIGLLKIDILGLRTLTVIKRTQELIQDKKIDLTNIPLDDPKTFELLRDTHTAGIFQLESRGMQSILKKMQIENINDLIAIISLYRPGPLGNINLNDFFQKKHGKKEIEYLHPLLKEVLEETYGTILYQEQVMEIARRIAGFDYAEADNLRRAMAKKIPELMTKIKIQFIEGAKKNGISLRTAQKIFDQIAPFAGYGFNKSHSAGYAHLSCMTAYLKAHYPLEFMTALITSEMGKDEDKLASYINEAKRMGIKILPPRINQSDYEFKIEGKNIRFGLGGIKNVGKSQSIAIIEERNKRGEFKSFEDFLIRTKKIVNKKSLESLIKAGSFDDMVPDRTQILNEMEEILKKISGEKAYFLKKQISLFQPLPAQHKAKSQKKKPYDTLSHEKDAFGFFLSGHPLDRYKEIYKGLELTPANEIDESLDGKNIQVGGAIIKKYVKRDKKGNPYASIVLRDYDGEIDVIIFNRVYEKAKEALKKDNLLIIKGICELKEDTPRPKIRAIDVHLFETMFEKMQILLLGFNPVGVEEEEIEKLYKILKENPGDSEVHIHLSNGIGKGSKEKVKIKSRNIKVKLSRKLLDLIKSLPGVEWIKLKGNI